MALRIPLKFSFYHAKQVVPSVGDVDAIGLVSEKITHTVDLHIAALPTAAPYLVFIINEIGLQVDVRSTGEAFDVDPVTSSPRKLVATSPGQVLFRRHSSR